MVKSEVLSVDTSGKKCKVLVKTKKGEAQKMAEHGTEANSEIDTLLDFIRHLSV